MKSYSQRILPHIAPNFSISSFRAAQRSGEDSIAHLETIAYWLDEGFYISSTGIRFGWDAIAKLVPIVGDTLSLIASLYLFRSFRRFGLPRVTLARMGVNIGIDYFVGMIPLIGTVFDVFWKPNVWNVALLKRHLAAADPQKSAKARRSDWIFLIAASIGVTVLLVASLLATYWILLQIVHLLASL